MGTAAKTLTVCFGITTVFIAYIYLRWDQRSEPHLERMEKLVADVWTKEIKYPEKPFSRLAVGFNTNVDLIVSGVALMKQLKVPPGKQEDHIPLTSLDDLQGAFSYFFNKGRAAERVFTDPELYKRVIKAAFELQAVEEHIGGNAGLMAKIMSGLFPDAKIQFVGPVGPIIQKLMPEQISIPSSSIVQQDEFHLIMEYKVGETWGQALAPVANRFIATYDVTNGEATMLETFFSTLNDFNPDLVLLSGLHLLDSQPQNFFDARLDALVAKLKHVQPSLPVHLEFASMANPAFMKSLLQVLPYVDSLGLNEQELAFASSAMGGPHSDHLETWEGQPMIHVMSDIIQWLMDSYGKSSSRPQSRLTRIHFHSLTYHIVAVHRKYWTNVESSVMAGTRIAGLQAGDMDQLHPDMVDLKIPMQFKLYSGDELREFDPKHPTHTWSVGDLKFAFSPVLVCKHPVKTVGLGDAISSTGLMYSQFSL